MIAVSPPGHHAAVGVIGADIVAEDDPVLADAVNVARNGPPVAEGAVTDPQDLGKALKRAIEVVKRGEPALVDVVTQPR